MTNKFTWYGHATLGLETNGFHILVDPFFEGNPATSVKADRIAADFILISHGHGDHVGNVVEIAKRTNALVISNFEICAWLEMQGIAKVHAQHLGGGYKHPFGYLKLTLALHGSMLPDGHNGGNPSGFLLTTADGKKIYMAQDTGLFGDMKMIGEEGIDLAVLPIGDNFTMGPEDALRAVKLIQPKIVVPIHYNTWDLISQDAGAWAKSVEADSKTKVRVLMPGESLEY
jgi:L-ascorbate metabolism protein UlaG (beta-lactamase superfamily)